jgi:Contractile injection system tube protein
MPIQEPERMSLGNLDTGDTLEVQYNPVSLKESFEPVYNRLKIVGMSHELLQYANSTNFLVEFDLHFDAVTRYRGGTYDVSAARKFLMSLGLSPRSSSNGLLSNGQPSSVLLLWPNLYSMTCKLTAYSSDLTTFAQDGSLLRFTSHIKIEEVRDVRLFADDVLVQGTIRPVNAPSDPTDAASNGGF